MQSRATVSTVLDDIGIGADRIAACSPLTGGTYNTVTRVTLTDGRDWVVKIPPPPTAAGMSYERDLLVNEATFYSAAAATGDVAVPGVVHSRLRSRLHDRTVRDHVGLSRATLVRDQPGPDGP